MRRAVIFAYDDERRLVRARRRPRHRPRAVRGRLADGRQARVARRRSRRIASWRSPTLERELPEAFHRLLQGGLLTCTPMAAGGRWFGVIIADRPPDAGGR